MENIIKKSNTRAWLIFAGSCVMVMLNFGLAYGVMSVCMYPLSLQFNTGLGVVALFFTFKAVGAICIDSFLASILEKLGARKQFIIASVGGGVCFFLMSFSKNVWMLNILAFVMAIFLEMNSLIPINMCVQNWFHKNTNLIVGLLSACAAGGSAIISPIFLSIFNAYGVKGTFMIAGLIFFVGTFICQFPLTRTPEEIGLVPYGWEANEHTEQGSIMEMSLPGMTFKEAIKSPVIYLVAIAIICCTGAAQYGTYLSSMCQSIGMATTVVATCVSLLNVCACAGNIALGWLRDKLGGLKMSVIGLGMIAVGGALYFIAYKSAAPTIMIAGVIFAGFGGCLGVSLGSFTASSACGPKDFAKIYGVLMMCANLAGAVMSPLYGFIFDVSSAFDLPLSFMIAMAVVAIPCMIIAIKSGQKKWNPNGEYNF